MGKHRMRGVAEQGQPPLGPDRQWLAIIERCPERQWHLLEQALDLRVPAGEFGTQSIRVARRRPTLAHLVVPRHEADESDQPPRPPPKGEKVFAVTKPHL